MQKYDYRIQNFKIIDGIISHFGVMILLKNSNQNYEHISGQIERSKF